MRDLLKSLGGNLPLHRWWGPQGSPLVVVLMYHDLCPDGDFANWMRVPATRFAAQLDTLSAIGGFVAPSALDAPQTLDTKRLSFLMTFDDGYRYNAELAAPLLEERGVPALYFVSTGPMLSRLPFWTDIVVTPIQALGLQDLDLAPVGLGRFSFRRGDPERRWTDVQRLLVAIKEAGNEGDPAVERLLAWFQDCYAQVLADHLPRFAPLDRDQVAALSHARHGHVGSHGHEHRVLIRLGDADLAEALSRSRSLLEATTGSPVVDLAYPNGDHDSRVSAAAAAAGFRRGYIVRSAPVAGRVAAMSIPRLAVGAFDTPALLRFKINRLLAAYRRRRISIPLELT